MGVDAVRQYSRQVLGKPAAGDVRHGLHPSAIDGGLQHRQVVAMRLQQRLAQRAVEAGWHGVHRQPIKQLTQERVAVCVGSVRGNAKQHIAGEELAVGQQLRSVDNTDERARDIERAGNVHTGHLGGLAAEQRTAADLAGLGHSGDDLRHMVSVEFATGDVIEEEQRLRALHQHITDAMVHDVGTDPVVLPQPCGELDLGSDAVGAGDQ